MGHNPIKYIDIYHITNQPQLLELQANLAIPNCCTMLHHSSSAKALRWRALLRQGNGGEGGDALADVAQHQIDFFKEC